MTADELQSDLMKYASDHDAVFLQRFFRTGKGEYGEGDVFIGVRVPQTRQVCRKYINLPLGESQKLLDSEIHEFRLAGLIILTLQYLRANEAEQKSIYDFYLTNLYKGNINNWDLIDITAHRIIGEYLMNGPRDILFELASSQDLWQRRTAILSSFRFIKNGDPSTSLALIELIGDDQRDLIQKANGWMLREIGKNCDEAILTDYLDKHYQNMPRTMLRYSLEKLSPTQKKHYMTR